MSNRNMQLTPVKIPCFRHRLKDADGNNLYMTVGIDDNTGKPLEVSASFVNETDHSKRDTLSGWTLACKLVSRSLSSGIALRDVMDDLEKSKVYSKDIPSQMASVLSAYC